MQPIKKKQKKSNKLITFHNAITMLVNVGITALFYQKLVFN